MNCRASCQCVCHLTATPKLGHICNPLGTTTPQEDRRRYCSQCDFYTDHVSTAHDGLAARGLLLEPPQTPEEARDQGIAQTTDHADPRLILTVDQKIAEFNATGMPWSANDLRDTLPVVNQPLVGARVRAAALRRPVEMIKVGETPSSLRSTHTKPVAVWQGVES